jgi:hypothetical protein
MASIISAGTTSGTALNMAGDTSGELQIATNGSTTAVTVDTSQNVGIGTTSPTAKLQVARAGGSVGSTNLVYVDVTSSFGGISINSTANNNTFVELMEAGTKVGGFNADTTNNVTSIQSSGGHVFAINTGGTTERMRIDTSGNVLVGTTTSDARLRVNGTTVIGKFIADGGGYTSDVVLIDTSGTAAGTGFDLIQANSGGAGQFRVRGDGTLFAQNTTVQSISDQRVKENIRDAEEGLGVVTALHPVRFDFKEGFGNNRKNQLGFIAQEIEQVFPEAVDVAAKEETDDEDAEPYKTVGAAALIPVLVKAIQEQQTIINDLTARITALEGAA